MRCVFGLLTYNSVVSVRQLLEWCNTLKSSWEVRIISSIPTMSVSFLHNVYKPNPVDLADLGSVLIIGLITESFFYTMLEAGMALIAVNLPSLWFFSISLKTGDILRSV